MNNLSSSQPILECRDLSKSYHDGTSTIDVLRHVDLEVRPSEMIAVVGNSGSGKSTLLHLLGGLDKPTSGEVLIKGKNLANISEKERCSIRNHFLGFVYQFHHLLPEFTAIENVCMPLLIRGVSPKIAESKAAHLLEMVGLKNRMTHKIGELSGGERQRVAIARALVIDPLCVLADEPTGNLDPKNAERVFELFVDLQKTFQTSVIIVTHDLRLAQQAQRILGINEGSLVAI
ncbi:MAG: lipoprotein-releasing ABC transporter ATP-binding protein LolD [Gammaproteobacteria bacterium]|nr:lipoprotein-releasing ABC transporter ATP-binding protein LolD [Gammaproteobacteria bacterium]